MKTIGEMLVETTARLVAAPDDSDAGYVASVKSVDYPDQARAIVTEFYGPPCKRVECWRDAVATPRASDVCRTCGWPRGEHGR